MTSFKDIWILNDLVADLAFGSRTLIVFLFLADSAVAGTCLAPQRPFVPGDLRAAQEYANLIRNDFERYIQDIQIHFRCLDQERSRAFEEAKEVSEEYGRFLGLLDE